jgi:putative transposase
LQKRYWGSHLWNRGYFCARVGALIEEQIQKYTADQSKGNEAFKVWDEVKGEEAEEKLKSDLSE